MSRPLEDVQDEILDRIHAGETIDQDAALAEHPEHAEALTAFFQVLQIVEGTADDGGPVPATLGEFRILREIGRGGMGVVYEAEQASLKRRVALKVLPPILRMDTRLVSRFRREAEAAGRLRHPGIVPVFSVGEAAGAPFFAMELVDGTSLQQVLAARRADEALDLPTEPDAWRRWAVETVAQVADALAYAHGQGILHRDVKPANILVEGGGAPRLTDFGLALDLRAPGLTQTGEVFGSPQYMSPEQALRREAPVDERTDVYSLAVTLYELLTLKLPYDAATSVELLTALAAGKVVPPRKVDPSIARPLEQVILRALQKSPRDRYRGAAEFASDLRAALAGRGIARVGPSLQRVAAVAAIGLVAIGATIGLVKLLYDASDEPTPTKVARNGESDASVLPVPGDASGPGDPSGDHQKEPPKPEPARPKLPSEVAGILSVYRASPPKTLEDYRVFIAALSWRDSEAARLALRLVYKDFVAGPGHDDEAARKFLGHKAFTPEIPEDLANRRYPYIQTVEHAARKHWFTPNEAEDLKRALKAWKETLAHRQRLIDDPRFRAADTARANLENDRKLRYYNLAFRWAEPYVLAYASEARLSVYDRTRPGAEDGAAEDPAAIEARMLRASALLDEKASIFQQTYREYMRRYQTKLDLKPLTDKYGGRPDYGRNLRSYPDGVPLVVLIFDSRRAFSTYHVKNRGEMVPRNIAGYFSPHTGHVYLYRDAAEGKNRVFGINKSVQEAVHQLQFWFFRQRNAWRKQMPDQSWLDVGFPEFFGAVKMTPDGALDYVDVNGPRLRGMQFATRMLKAQGREYPVFPLSKLTAFRSFGEVQAWGASNWKLDPVMVLGLFLQQSWALVHFLNHAEEGHYRGGFDRFYRLVMDGERQAGPGSKAFRDALRIPLEHDWEPLDRAFQAYLRDHLLKLEPEDYDYEPPKPRWLSPK